MTEIAILKPSPRRQGGLEKYTRHLIEAFRQKGCSVTWISNHPLAQVQWKPKFPFHAFNVMDYDRFCRHYLKNRSFPVILGLDRTSDQTHIRAGNGVHAAYLAIRRRNEPLWKRASFAINPLHQTILNIEKTSFENPKLQSLIVNSHLVRKQILHHYNVTSEKIVVIHNGVEWQSLAQPFSVWSEKKTQFLQQNNLPTSCIHLLFIGHNFGRKGLALLLSALAHLSQKNFHLSVVGEDRHAAHFQKLALQLGIHSQVSFWGKQSDPVSFYQMADVAIIPSLYDPFANVTLEALAMGLYTVSSNMNGGSEVITANNGSVFDIEQEDSLIQSLEQALQQHKTLTSAQRIRDSVQHLDFSHQLQLFCSKCLS